MVRANDAVDQPQLRPWRRARPTRGKRVLQRRRRRKQRRRRHCLLYLHREGSQRRDEHQHELCRAGLGDELERGEGREEEEGAMREGREEEREGGREG